MSKTPKLDKATAELAKRVLALPPKPHGDLKVGRVAKGKRPSAQSPASSAKPRDA